MEEKTQNLNYPLLKHNLFLSILKEYDSYYNLNCGTNNDRTADVNIDTYGVPDYKNLTHSLFTLTLGWAV